MVEILPVEPLFTQATLECGSRTLRIPEGGSRDSHLGPGGLSRAPWGVLTAGWVENHCLEPPGLREPRDGQGTPVGLPASPEGLLTAQPLQPVTQRSDLLSRKPRPNLESSANDTE